jgi:hypothetical protein
LGSQKSALPCFDSRHCAIEVKAHSCDPSVIRHQAYFELQSADALELVNVEANSPAAIKYANSVIARIVYSPFFNLSFRHHALIAVQHAGAIGRKDSSTFGEESDG